MGSGLLKRPRTPADLAAIYLAAHPVGSLYVSFDKTSPAELYGGAWEQIKDRFLLAAGDAYNADSTGGAASVTSGGTAISVAQMPAHSHGVDGIQWPGPGDQPGWTGWGEGPNVRTTTTSKITGGGQPHTHTVATMPPYIVAYVWRRVG